METNKYFPLPETCKELGDAFPEWRTQKRFRESDCHAAYLDPESYSWIAPSHQELWEKLPELISNKEYRLAISKIKVSYQEIYFDELGQDNLYPISIVDNHVTEAWAQMLLRLKKEGHLDGK